MLSRIASTIARPTYLAAQAPKAMTVGAARTYATARTSEQDEALAQVLINANNYANARRDEQLRDGLRLYGMTGRYAHALFNAARKAGKTDVVAKDLQAIITTSKTSPAFGEFISDPTLPVELKSSGVTGILEKLKVSDMTANFFSVLAENGRLDASVRIAEGYGELVRDLKGEIEATVTFAVDQDIDDAMKATLKKFVKPHQTLILSKKVDPSILGGIVINIGDRSIDMSVRRKVNAVHNLVEEGIRSYSSI
eukprot:GFYU01004528.1.p2 GENE.GFYU01004528.1~~GFYU01004528.1.p2  ORF type:complete len:253 (+),score=88.87 GFYU01004528.1:37-795(+)